MCVCVCINGITTNTTHSAPFLRAGRLPASSHILYSKIPLHEKINPNPNPKPCLRPVLAGLLLILRNPYRCCELASSLHQCIFCIVTFHCAQFFFFFCTLHNIQLTPQNPSAWRKNHPGAPGAGVRPEDQVLHRGRKPGRRRYQEVLLP